MQNNHSDNLSIIKIDNFSIYLIRRNCLLNTRIGWEQFLLLLILLFLVDSAHLHIFIFVSLAQQLVHTSCCHKKVIINSSYNFDLRYTKLFTPANFFFPSKLLEAKSWRFMEVSPSDEILHYSVNPLRWQGSDFSKVP